MFEVNIFKSLKNDNSKFYMHFKKNISFHPDLYFQTDKFINELTKKKKRERKRKLEFIL